MGRSSHQNYRLEEHDDFPHPVEDAVNFNESMYINVFDHRQQIGAWFRVGNRPNEGYAEVSCCIYLTGGRVAFMFQREAINGNAAITAGGMRFEIVEAFKRLRLRHKGQVCVLERPADMEDPKTAFRDNPVVDCEVDLDFVACAPAVGGEPMDAQGKVVEQAAESAFFRGHYEQHMAASGGIRVGPEQFSIEGLGLRDHSWGPRYWQNIHWYRWMPLNFSKDFAVASSIIAQADGSRDNWAMVLDGEAYRAAEDVTLSTEYDERDYPQRYTLTISTDAKTYQISAEVLSLIPLRNRRRGDDGRWLHTRIVEGFTRFSCGGRVGYGMTEFLDQVLDGRPAGRALC